MLSRLRHLFVDSWFGRILIGLIFIVFVGWGVSDIFLNIWNNGFNDPNVVAKVGNKKISLSELNNMAQKELSDFTKQQGFSDPSQIPAIVKSSLVNQVLQSLITQNVLINHGQALGLDVPDGAVRDFVWSVPVFQSNGKFDRQLLNNYLSQTNTSEANFLNNVRDQLTITGVLDPMETGFKASDTMVKPFFQFENQTRVLTYIKVPYNHFHAVELPSEALLRRFYDNHLWQFKIPEYRHIKLLVLSPETIAKSMDISDQVLRQYYENLKNNFIKGESRNFQLVTFPDQHAAQALADLWHNQADWQKVQEFAQKNQGTALEMSELQQAAIPLPELAHTVFSSSLNQVTEPFKTMTGWSVVKVTKIIPGQHINFEEAKPQLRLKVAQEQAGQVLGERVKRLQDSIAGGNGLDKIDSTIGADGSEGTVNEQGFGLDGQVAPLPVDGKVKQAILTKIFSTSKNAQPRLIAAENNTYYAFIVDNIIPAHVESYDKAKDKVAKAWQAATVYRQANVAATEIYKEATVEKKQLSNIKSDFALQVSQPFSRVKPIQNFSADLQNKAFMMKQGDITMMEAADGFIVASLTTIKTPEAKDDPTNYQRIKENITRLLQNDSEMSYANALQKNAKSSVNQKALETLTNQLTN